MELLIRDAVPDDAAAIVSVFNPIIESHSFTLFDMPFTVEAERSYIEGLAARDIFHVAVKPDDNTIVGFQSMSPFANYTHAFDHVGVIGTYVDLASRRAIPVWGEPLVQFCRLAFIVAKRGHGGQID